MLKTKFIFSAIATSHFTRRNQRSIKRMAASGNKQSADCMKNFCKNMFHQAASPLLKAGAVLGVAIALNLPTQAQCKTFTANSHLAATLGIANGSIAGFDFADIDGDGDLDCYVRFTYTSSIVLYRNVGTADYPVYKKSSESGFENVSLPGATPYIQFVDIDGDGDYDCFMSGYNSRYYGQTGVTFYENTGTAAHPLFVESGNNPVSFAYSYHAVPFTFADIDGDGDLDFYFANVHYDSRYSAKSVYLNDGTKQKPHYTFYSYNNDYSNNFLRTYYDWNHDGLLDYFDYNNAFYNTFPNTITVNYYENTGTHQNPAYTGDNALGPVFPTNYAPYRLIDINKDGAPDLFTPHALYATLAPVAVINENSGATGDTLVSKNQSAAYQYKWELNGNTIRKAIGPVLPISRNGYYSLFVTDSCGTGFSNLYHETGESSAIADGERNAPETGLSASAITAKAYPNPFVSEFTIQLPAAKAIASTIQILDAAGRILLTQTTSTSSVTIGKTLPAGAYMVQVLQKGTMVYHTTIVKQ